MPAPEPTPKQQLNELVKRARSILVLPHVNADGDALGSALALQIGLTKLGKDVTVIAQGDNGDHLAFLPGYANIQREPILSKDLLLVLDETQARIGNVSLRRISETKLVVVVTPKEGVLTPRDARIEEGSFQTDLVITLDVATTELLNPLYDENPNLFYEVPVVNIDHHPGNANFGTVNIVEPAASSTAEVMVAILETLGKDTPLIDADVATCLLTGITSDTGSFQNSNTTPKSLTVAAQLVAAGARQQEIIQQLYKSRTLSTLRLWGRALAYIKEDQPHRFAWSCLRRADFVAAQASPDEASGVIDELMKTASSMDFVLLLSERGEDVHGSLRATRSTFDVSRLAHLFGGGGHTQAAAFRVSKATLAEREQEIVGEIRTYLDSQNSSSPSTSQPVTPPPTPSQTPPRRPSQPFSPGKPSSGTGNTSSNRTPAPFTIPDDSLDLPTPLAVPSEPDLPTSSVATNSPNPVKW